MSRIAVCEDSEMERIVLLEQIRAWADKRKISIELEGFSDGSALLAAFRNKRFDILFLDILMENIDGIAVGKEIRRMDAKSEMIYCTSSTNFAIEAYELHARDYLLKPYEPDKIWEILDKYNR